MVSIPGASDESDLDAVMAAQRQLRHDPCGGATGSLRGSVQVRTTRWIMVAIAILSVVVAIAVPGYQFWLIVFGGGLVAFAVFGLITE